MNINLLFNDREISGNSFIIDKDNIKKIINWNDMKIDYNVFFRGIIKVNNFKELDKLLESDSYEYNFKKYIFLNFIKYKSNELKKNRAIISDIIYKNFNIKNREISYIFKSLSKKNILEIIENNYL
jgi:hypothetical protein